MGQNPKLQPSAESNDNTVTNITSPLKVAGQLFWWVEEWLTGSGRRLDHLERIFQTETGTLLQAKQDFSPEIYQVREPKTALEEIVKVALKWLEAEAKSLAALRLTSSQTTHNSPTW